MADNRSEVLEFVATAAARRAMHYREQAAHLREMAASEPIGRLRERLHDLAAQYDRLADTVVGGNGPASPD
jgi:hypothetical protein